MRRAFSQPLLGSSVQSDRPKGRFVRNRFAIIDKEGNHEELDDDDDDEIEEIGSQFQFQCMTLHKREPPKQGEEPYSEKYGLWRQGQKIKTSRLQKQLKSRWALEDLIDDQLTRFHIHYNRTTIVPTRPKDLTHLLMPKSVPVHELAATAWLGDWRPSSILRLLRSLTLSSTLSLTDSAKTLQALSQLIHDIQIEEAVIDEEMSEIQATCILHLPFGRMRKCSSSPTTALASVQSEFKKIHAVIVNAQNLRFKALEMVVKKVLSDRDAAEFLVAFAGIQESIHKFGLQFNSKRWKGKISVTKEGEKTVKRLESVF